MEERDNYFEAQEKAKKWRLLLKSKAIGEGAEKGKGSGSSGKL